MRRSARNRSAPVSRVESLASLICIYAAPASVLNRIAVETGCRAFIPPRVSTGFALIADDAAITGSVRDEMEKLWGEEGGRERKTERDKGEDKSPGCVP